MVLGTMTFGGQTSEPESFDIMDAAAGAGINFIDTANVHPSGAMESNATSGPGTRPADRSPAYQAKRATGQQTRLQRSTGASTIR